MSSAPGINETMSDAAVAAASSRRAFEVGVPEGELRADDGLVILRLRARCGAGFTDARAMSQRLRAVRIEIELVGFAALQAPCSGRCDHGSVIRAELRRRNHEFHTVVRARALHLRLEIGIGRN